MEYREYVYMGIYKVNTAKNTYIDGFPVCSIEIYIVVNIKSHIEYTFVNILVFIMTSSKRLVLS